MMRVCQKVKVYLGKYFFKKDILSMTQQSSDRLNTKKPLLFLLLGIALGVAVMFWFNRPETPLPISQTNYVEFKLEMAEDILSLTHGFSGSIIRVPHNIISLENSPLSNMIGLVARIRNTDGKLVGLASELEIFPDDAGPRPGMSWKTHWTITTTEGSLLIYETESIPLAHIPAFTSVIAGNDWTGSITANVSSGPHPTGRGVIVGGTGIYDGARGTFIERVELRGLTTKGEMVGTMYLQIYLDHDEK